MTKLIFSLFILLTLSSCYQVNESETIVPEKLLTKEQMVQILTEIQITEAGFSINKNKNIADELKPEYYNKILVQYSISLKQFKQNLRYYHDSPKIMEEIYESVLAELSKVQNKVIREKEDIDKKIKNDSIAMINDSIALVNDSLNLTLKDSSSLASKKTLQK